MWKRTATGSGPAFPSAGLVLRPPPFTAHAGPGDLVSASYGVVIPSVAVPLFNLDGATELLQNITPLFPLKVAPTDGHFQLIKPVGGSPALVGLQLPIQGLAFDDPVWLTGSFTNMFRLTIQ